MCVSVSLAESNLTRCICACAFGSACLPACVCAPESQREMWLRGPRTALAACFTHWLAGLLAWNARWPIQLPLRSQKIETFRQSEGEILWNTKRATVGILVSSGVFDRANIFWAISLQFHSSPWWKLDILLWLLLLLLFQFMNKNLLLTRLALRQD